MKPDHPKYILELSAADDIRLKTGMAERIDSDTPISIPNVGDTVYVENRHLAVVARRFSYYNGTSHVECFCKETTEDNIRVQCGLM